MRGGGVGGLYTHSLDVKVADHSHLPVKLDEEPPGVLSGGLVSDSPRRVGDWNYTHLYYAPRRRRCGGDEGNAQQQQGGAHLVGPMPP